MLVPLVILAGRLGRRRLPALPAAGGRAACGCRASCSPCSACARGRAAARPDWLPVGRPRRPAVARHRSSPGTSTSRCPTCAPRSRAPLAAAAARLRRQVLVRRRLRRLREARRRGRQRAASSGSGVDAGLIDGVVNGAGRVARAGSARRLRPIQTGFVRHYALAGARGRGRRRLLPALVMTALTSHLLTLLIAPAGRRGARRRAHAARESESLQKRARPRRSSAAAFVAVARCSWRGFERRRRACSSSSARPGSPPGASATTSAIDGLSLWLVILTTFLTPLALLGSWTSIHDARARVRGLHAPARGGHARRVRRARPVPVLRVLGGDARSRCTS